MWDVTARITNGIQFMPQRWYFVFPAMAPTSSTGKKKIPKITDLWTKLWGETERSVALARLILDECNIRVKQIDLDYNSDPSYPSQKLIAASSGYIASLGFEAKAKPNLLMAAWAANVLCQ
jgi:predicted RNase H-related nuclease YkuK (DUF458 family)